MSEWETFKNFLTGSRKVTITKEQKYAMRMNRLLFKYNEVDVIGTQKKSGTLQNMRRTLERMRKSLKRHENVKQ